MATHSQSSSGLTGGDSIPDVNELLQRHHANQLNLCTQLESIADSLPEDVDPQACLHAARSIFPTIKNAHQFEEKELFPLVESRAHASPEVSQSLERLRFEHWEDESYAEEISESLTSYVMEPENRNPESLSYMLRGFFEGIRRHIAFEVEHIQPLLRNRQSLH